MTTPKMLARQLRYILNQRLTLRLYTSLDGDREESIVEMAGGGYTPRIFTVADWSFDERTPQIATSTVHDFRFDGSKRETVNGGYLTNDLGEIYWIEPFQPRPIEVGRRGDIIPVRAIVGLAPLS